MRAIQVAAFGGPEVLVPVTLAGPPRTVLGKTLLTVA
jgi:hypothetical protein